MRAGQGQDQQPFILEVLTLAKEQVSQARKQLAGSLKTFVIDATVLKFEINQLWPASHWADGLLCLTGHF